MAKKKAAKKTPSPKRAPRKRAPKPNPNLALWERHCVTDPATTSRFQRAGKTLTAICPTAQAKQATEEFGAYGDGWGLDRVEYETLRVGESVSVVCHAHFYAWRYGQGLHDSVRFPISADMPWVPNTDVYKRLRTECQSKALAMLGWGADLREEEPEGGGEGVPQGPGRAHTFGDQDTRLRLAQGLMDEATTAEQLDKILDNAKAALPEATYVRLESYAMAKRLEVTGDGSPNPAA